MKRGFKAEAERIAARFRSDLGLLANESLPMSLLAQSLEVVIEDMENLVVLSELEHLEELQPGAFSAITFDNLPPDGRTVVATNPVNATPGRTNSNLAHELAHIILGHDLRTIERVGALTLFTCNPEQEDEANWLAGCLLLPRTLLLAEVRKGHTSEQIAAGHEVSEDMARFRINTSGVMMQVRR